MTPLQIPRTQADNDYNSAQSQARSVVERYINMMLIVSRVGEIHSEINNALFTANSDNLSKYIHI